MSKAFDSRDSKGIGNSENRPQKKALRKIPKRIANPPARRPAEAIATRRPSEWAANIYRSLAKIERELRGRGLHGVQSRLALDALEAIVEGGEDQA